MRLLFTEVLRNNGFLVIACEDGESALEVLRTRVDGITAVVTDARMPGIDGRELIARIRPLRPGLPVLVVSGTLDESVASANVDPATRYLVKPLSPDQLIVELRQALCGAETGSVR